MNGREADRRGEGDARELARLLDADPATGAPRPMWPAVAAARAPRRRDLLLAFGVPAAVAAGLVVGVLLGGGPAGTGAATGTSASVASDWTAFSAERGATLDEIWWSGWTADANGGTGTGDAS